MKYALAVLLLAAFFSCAAEPKTDQPSDFVKYTETIPGSEFKFDMVPIPGGTFTMGSPATEAGRNIDEGPQHEVTVTPFWMSTLEVQWAEFGWYAFERDKRAKEAAKIDMKAQPDSEKEADAVTRPTKPYENMTFGYGTEGMPAICFTHHTALEYCRWLSAKTKKNYRLPTEAEWEFAVRGGTKTAFFWGDDPTKADEYAWFKGNADQKPHKVGEKKPNPYGLYDIAGNVAEWCVDHYDNKFYAQFKDKPAFRPVIIPDEDEYSYVVRGGSWMDKVSALRCAARMGSDEDWSKQDPNIPRSRWWHTEARYVGLRVVRPIEEQDNLKGFKSPVKRDSERR